MSFNKLMVLFLISMCLTNGSPAASSNIETAREIHELKQKIVKLQTVDDEVFSINERFYKHQLAVSQVRAAKKVAAYETYIFLSKSGTKRNMSEINKIVDVAWECSFIFTDLGNNPMERFKLILEWCKSETNFKANMVSSWKKGQYIKSLNATVKKDTTDYGAWQINEDNFVYSQNVYELYKAGVISFKIIKPKVLTDLFDIPTNCAIRCTIETDRKDLGWEWRHHKAIDKPYAVHLDKKMKELEVEGLYDAELVAKYYKLTPFKTYSAKAQ